MSNSRKYAVVYNSGGSPVEVDSETGTQLLPHTFAAVQRSQVQNFINDGSFVVVDDSTINDESAPDARQAKADYDRLTAEWDKEKAAKAEPESTAVAADYDDSAKTTSSKASSTKRGN